MAYDDKHFITSGSDIRHNFLQESIRMPGGKSLVAMDTEECVIGYGCRRLCFLSGGHIVGPLYADSADVALTLLKALCREIVGMRLSLLCGKFVICSVHDISYVHSFVSLCFVVLLYWVFSAGAVISSAHFLHGCFTCTEATVLPRCQWSNHERHTFQPVIQAAPNPKT